MKIKATFMHKLMEHALPEVSADPTSAMISLRTHLHRAVLDPPLFRQQRHRVDCQYQSQLPVQLGWHEVAYDSDYDQGHWWQAWAADWALYHLTLRQ